MVLDKVDLQEARAAFDRYQDAMEGTSELTWGKLLALLRCVNPETAWMSNRLKHFVDHVLAARERNHPKEPAR
jgi:S-ribosylhomocysteine lyase LuxS involved in autoinducer biosynthesis